jgi:nucleoside-diphosphate-sugar epimerase
VNGIVSSAIIVNKRILYNCWIDFRMKIALFGASSNIAQDVIFKLMAADFVDQIDLYSRNPSLVMNTLVKTKVTNKTNCLDYADFISQKNYGFILNFIGLGCPQKILERESELIDIADYYDELIISHLKKYQPCGYIYLSSGAVYGTDFHQPVPKIGKQIADATNGHDLSSYTISKIRCELRHRALSNIPIIDLRIFSYFSARHSLNTKLFMAEICNSIKLGKLLHIEPEPMVRDYIHPGDFYKILELIMVAPPRNGVIDCYSKAPIEKIKLLEIMASRFNLQYKTKALGSKPEFYNRKEHYYSLVRTAEDLGYSPRYTSEEALINECQKLFQL